MQDFFGTLIGKSIKLVLSYRKNGGQALPGLVIERLFPGYVSSMLAQLPEGIVVITGTNGKTTTTKIVTQMLKANGKKVLTNPTGSNLVRGIASSLAQHANAFGKLRYDIAILEVDEATARKLVGVVKPRWVLALNVSRDQLDRYGEVDTIASYIGAAMESATEGVVTNARDPHLVEQAGKSSKQTYFFGAAPRLSNFFPTDYELAAVGEPKNFAAKSQRTDVELARFNGQKVEYMIGGKKYAATLQLSGQHNFLNGAAALALCRRLLPGIKAQDLVTELSEVSLAFGRGERYRMKNGAEVELVLVKNPASFTQALLSYGSQDASLMIAINDNIADGRDVSWLWDVDFSPLKGRTVAVTSGKRAADMALRLSYDDIDTEDIEPRLLSALNTLSDRHGRKVILSTYTAMLQLYRYLNKRAQKIA